MVDARRQQWRLVGGSDCWAAGRIGESAHPRQRVPTKDPPADDGWSFCGVQRRRRARVFGAGFLEEEECWFGARDGILGNGPQLVHRQIEVTQACLHLLEFRTKASAEPSWTWRSSHRLNATLDAQDVGTPGPSPGRTRLCWTHHGGWLMNWNCIRTLGSSLTNSVELLGDHRSGTRNIRSFPWMRSRKCRYR